MRQTGAALTTITKRARLMGHDGPRKDYVARAHPLGLCSGPMTLDQHLKKTGESTRAFAIRMRCAASTISRIRRGQQEPLLALANKIIADAKGKIRHQDLIRRRNGHG